MLSHRGSVQQSPNSELCSKGLWKGNGSWLSNSTRSYAAAATFNILRRCSPCKSILWTKNPLIGCQIRRAPRPSHIFGCYGICPTRGDFSTDSHEDTPIEPHRKALSELEGHHTGSGPKGQRSTLDISVLLSKSTSRSHEVCEPFPTKNTST